MPQWTETEWTYNPIPGYQYVVEIDKQAQILLVAAAVPAGREEEVKANMRLASAAPKLYKALARALVCYDDSGNRELIAECRAALDSAVLPVPSSESAPPPAGLYPLALIDEIGATGPAAPLPVDPKLGLWRCPNCWAIYSVTEKSNQTFGPTFTANRGWQWLAPGGWHHECAYDGACFEAEKLVKHPCVRCVSYPNGIENGNPSENMQCATCGRWIRSNGQVYDAR